MRYLSALIALAAAALATAAPAAERVATPFTLSTVVNQSAYGDEIVFAPAAWGDKTISGKSGLKLTFQTGAKFTSLKLSNLRDITASGLNAELLFKPGITTRGTPVVLVSNSTNVRLSKCRLKGAIATTGVPQTATTLDPTGNVIGLASGYALQVYNSSKVYTDHCDMSQAYKAVLCSSSRDLTFEDLDLHDNRTSPFACPAYSGLTVRRVHAWNSKTWGYGGSYDHGDGFTNWTWAAMGANPRDFLYEDNFFDAGTGTQLIGMYMMAHDGGWCYENLRLLRNLVITSHELGLYVECTVSGEATGNIVLANYPPPSSTTKHPYGYFTGRNGMAIGTKGANRINQIYVPSLSSTALAGVRAANRLGPTTAAEREAAKAAWMAKFRAVPIL